MPDHCTASFERKVHTFPQDRVSAEPRVGVSGRYEDDDKISRSPHLQHREELQAQGGILSARDERGVSRAEAFSAVLLVQFGGED